MTGRVRRDGAFARKSFHRIGAVSGREAARRSAILAAAGVPTPIGRHDSATDEVVFPWLEGKAGRAYLAAESAVGAGHAVHVAVLQTLISLHRADPSCLRPPPFDPWRRITPRLAVTGPESGVTDDAREAVAAALRGVADDGASAGGLIHGDFHIGQLIFAAPDATPWLLDLEDLAIGPAEADLGNFIAHIVTSEDLYDGVLADGFRRLAGSLRAAYQAEAGVTLSADRIAAYGAAALLRRGLKLRECGRRRPVPLDVVAAAIAVAR